MHEDRKVVPQWDEKQAQEENILPSFSKILTRTEFLSLKANQKLARNYLQVMYPALFSTFWIKFEKPKGKTNCENIHPYSIRHPQNEEGLCDFCITSLFRCCVCRPCLLDTCVHKHFFIAQIRENFFLKLVLTKKIRSQLRSGNILTLFFHPKLPNAWGNFHLRTQSITYCCSKDYWMSFDYPAEQVC